MRVTHHTRRGSISGVGAEDSFFFLGNPIGDYVSFPSRAGSKYHGWVIHTGRGEYIKILSRCGRKPEAIEPRSIVTYENAVVRSFPETEETLWLDPSRHTLNFAYSSRITLTPAFDVRPLFSFPEWGRSHCVAMKERVAVLETEAGGSRLCVAIASDGDDYRPKGTWERDEYWLDGARRSPPFGRYVYQPFSLTGRRFACAVRDTPEGARREAQRALRQRVPPRLVQKITGKSEQGAAACLAGNAISRLFLKNGESELRAGLPWFGEEWTRDALIAVPALPHADQISLLKRYWEMAQENASLPARRGSSLASADGVGWLLFQLLRLPQKAQEEIAGKEFKRAVLNFIDRWASGHVREGLFSNGPRETWMDSIDRSGARIELQALLLRAYRHAYALSHDEAWRVKEEATRREVRRRFWTGAALQDGSGDAALRPNLFLAAYAYPWLLTQEEWNACFQSACKALWQPWGGMSTVDANDERFHAYPTGENPASYHNGDSWFYLNNITALVLRACDAKRFAPYIKKILSASTEELCWHGALGSPGEISAASHLGSVGSWSQAWSASTYLELLAERKERLKPSP